MIIAIGSSDAAANEDIANRIAGLLDENWVGEIDIVVTTERLHTRLPMDSQTLHKLRSE